MAGRTVIRVAHDPRPEAGRVLTLDQGRLHQAPAVLASGGTTPLAPPTALAVAS